jgi:anaerobic ribonucleoside-triphosphate reductase activating protein
MTLFLSRLHFPVTTLGFGRRIGIWFQGCSIRCPGCVSRDTWEFGQGQTTVKSVCESISAEIKLADGVTVSGGEPFDQPAALEALLRWLRANCGGDILVFSGYPWEQIEPRVSQWGGFVDVLISDPFDARAGHTLALRGSDNQRVHLLTPLARERYWMLPNSTRRKGDRVLDVVFDGDKVWMAGIPGDGDMERLRQKLLESGFSAETSENPRVLA